MPETTILTGRDLDVAIARHVFGDEVEQRTTPIRGTEWYSVSRARDTGRTGYARVPYYSDRAVYAFYVVDHMRREHGAYLLLEQHRRDEVIDVDTGAEVKSGQWSAHFQDVALLGTGIGNTEGEAICRAALQAVGAA